MLVKLPLESTKCSKVCLLDMWFLINFTLDMKKTYWFFGGKKLHRRRNIGSDLTQILGFSLMERWIVPQHPGNHIQMVWSFVWTGPSINGVRYVRTAEGRGSFSRGSLKFVITPPNHQIREKKKLYFSYSSAEVATANMAPISIKSVLISESVDPRCKSILEENGIRVTEKQNMKKEELIAEIKVSCALFPRVLRYTRLFATKVTRLKPHQRSGDLVSNHSGGVSLRARVWSVHRAPYFTLGGSVK